MSENLPAESSEQLISEILEIMKQYENEVSGTGRRWPKSIRVRVVELVTQGVRKSEISKRTKIPIATLHSWFRGRSPGRKARFVQIPTARVTPAAGVSSSLSARSTLAVRFSDGMKVSGLTIDELIELRRSL